MTSSFVPTMWSGFDSDVRNFFFADNDPRCFRTVAANGTTSCVQSLSCVVLAGCNVTRSSNASHDTESTMSLQSCRARYDFRISRARSLLAERCHDALIPQTRASIFAFNSYVTAMIDDWWAYKIVSDSLYFGYDESKISRTVHRSWTIRPSSARTFCTVTPQWLAARQYPTECVWCEISRCHVPKCTSHTSASGRYVISWAARADSVRASGPYKIFDTVGSVTHIIISWILIKENRNNDSYDLFT